MKTENAKLISQCFSELYQLGLTTSSGGNISCKDENGVICISPSQIDKGYLKTEDFAFLNANGKPIGNQKPSMEYPFHLSLYKSKPKVKCIIHIHAPGLVALSLLSENNPDFKIPQKKFKIAIAPYAIPGSDLLGKHICEAFNEGIDFVLMQNHGVIALGKDLFGVKERLINLNQGILEYFKLEAFVQQKRFNLPHEDSIAFYEQRAKHFLSSKQVVKFSHNKENDFYFTSVQFETLKELNPDKFSTHIIPESFLILRDPHFLNEAFNPKQEAKYLSTMKTETDVLLFKSGRALLCAKTPYQLYDKLEVLEFTGKVCLIAQKMGDFNLLTTDQIQELREQFF